MKINRLLTNICTDDLAASKQFYTSLFDFTVDYDSDWFVHLISKGRELEIGLISKHSDVVPIDVANQPGGMYLTFVVDSVSDLYKKACKLDFTVIQPPELTSYGQNRMLLLSSEGFTIDVSSPSE